MAPHSTLRASDADRDAVAERLRRAAVEGRLDPDELEERLHAALRARTYGDLKSLLTDLPSKPVAWERRRLEASPAAHIALAVAMRVVLTLALVAIVVTVAALMTAWWIIWVIVWFGLCGRRSSVARTSAPPGLASLMRHRSCRWSMEAPTTTWASSGFRPGTVAERTWRARATSSSRSTPEARC